MCSVAYAWCRKGGPRGKQQFATIEADSLVRMLLCPHVCALRMRIKRIKRIKGAAFRPFFAFFAFFAMRTYARSHAVPGFHRAPRGLLGGVAGECLSLESGKGLPYVRTLDVT